MTPISRHLLGAAATLGALTATLPASADASSGLYGLVAGGTGYWETYDASRTATLVNVGGGTATVDKFSAAYKLGVGYQFNTYSGVEVAYHHGGKYDVSLRNTGAGDADITLKVRRVAFTYVLTIPAGKDFSFLGRLGAHRWQEDITSANASAKRNGTNMTFGLGGKYRLRESTDLTLEYENFQNEDSEGYQTFGALTAGLWVRF